MAFANEPKTAWGLVTHGPFSRFFWAGFISSVGDWAALFAQIALADAIAGPTGILVVLAARLLPGLVGGAIGGVLADRVDRKIAIVASDFGRAGLLLTLAFVDDLGALFVVSVLLETLTLLGQPARAAAVANLVAPANLLTANSLMLGAAYGTFPIGAAISWLIGIMPTVSLLGILPDTTEAMVFAVDSLTFLVSGLLVMSIATVGGGKAVAARKPGGKRDWRGPLQDLVEGVVFVAKNAEVRSVVLCMSVALFGGVVLGMSVALFGGGMLIVLGRTFSADVLRADEAGFFAMLTALGTGAAAGIIGLSVYGDRILRRDVTFGASLVVSGIALAAASLVSTVAGAMAWLFVMGIGAGAAYVTGFTHLHEQVEDELRGRTFAALFSLMRIGLLVSMAVAAPVADLLEGRSPTGNATRDILLLGGIVVFSAGAGVLWSLRHTFRRPKLTAEGLESMDAAGRALLRWRLVRRRNDDGPLDEHPTHEHDYLVGDETDELPRPRGGAAVEQDDAEAADD
jgi:dTMP kinase